MEDCWCRHCYSKKMNSRGVRKKYIPGCNLDCDELYNTYVENGDPDISGALLETLDNTRERWMEFQKVKQTSMEPTKETWWKKSRSIGLLFFTTF